jgi:hypothetical protein
MTTDAVATDTTATDTTATETVPPTQTRWRAADADRHRTVHELQDAVARGLLTSDEAGERMAAAYAAQHLDELPVLTADLPPAAAPTPDAPGWRLLATLALLQGRAGVAWLTANGLRSRRGLAALAVLLVVLAGLVALVVGGFDGGGGAHGFDGPHGHRG